jgi:hypothetical protein
MNIDKNFISFQSWFVYLSQYELDDRGSIPGRGNDGIFSFRKPFQTDYGAHPASFPMGTGCSDAESKAARSWTWGYECMELYVQSSNTTSWRGD